MSPLDTSDTSEPSEKIETTETLEIIYQDEYLVAVTTVRLSIE